MPDWKNPNKQPPPNEVVVEVTGDDYTGDWIMKMMRKDYKQKPTNTKRFYRDNGKYWRWVYADGFFTGTTIEYKDQPYKWREIT